MIDALARLRSLITSYAVFSDGESSGYGYGSGYGYAYSSDFGFCNSESSGCSRALCASSISLACEHMIKD